MNKKDFITAIAAKASLSQKQATQVVNSLLSLMTEALASTGEFRLPGVGRFTVKQRASRQGRNPRTGEAIKIAATRAPTFKASSDLKKQVNS